MSFEHFQDFGPRPCTIYSLMSFQDFRFFGKRYKTIKNDMLYDHGLEPVVFSTFSRFWTSAANSGGVSVQSIEIQIRF